MSFDNTITEHDLDASSLASVQGIRADQQVYEPDLAVDGLTDSLFSRLLRLLGVGRR